MRRDWWVPLTGVAFVALVIIGVLVGGEPPEASEPVQEIVDHYRDNEGAIVAGAILAGVAATVLIFFAGILRKVLREAEGEGGVLSLVAFAGAVVLAVGAAIDGTISFALADQADEIDPTAVQALQALWDNDFLPLALGIQVFLLASGISIVLHAPFPRWLGWAAILLALISITPIGFAAFIGGAVWIIVISVLMTLRFRSSGPTPPARPVAGP
jgi:hypothetical protein